jgi:multimeric flavodoxin WrbA
MKIVLVHGQNHKGSTYNIGRMIADQIGGEITEFFLPKDLNHFCHGCYTCIDDDTKCPYYEEKNKIMKEVEAADVLIFTTPTYCMRASAPMKSFIDLTFNYWMAHRPRQCMFSKRAVVVSTAAGAGTKTAVKDVVTALNNWGVSCVIPYGLSVQAMNWEGVSDKKKAKIDSDTTKIANKISNMKKVKTAFKTKFMFGLMRMMQLKDLGSSKVEKEYWENNGWFGKARPWK